MRASKNRSDRGGAHGPTPENGARLRAINDRVVACTKCPRLVEWRSDVAREKRAAYAADRYWGRPVPSFGDPDAELLIVGLAPGAHGANRTGRPFTGDHAGILLYRSLYKFGFSSAEQSLSADDNLKLTQCRITNAVKCLPPDNKPVGAEVNNCNTFLAAELQQLPDDAVVLALGGVAHRAIIKAIGRRQAEFKFAHAALHDLGEFLLLDSYHCSRYNTNTGRLTSEMFEGVFEQARELLDK